MTKRFEDMISLSYNRGVPMFTDFLDLNQQSQFYNYINNSKNKPPVKCELYGGLYLSEIPVERKIAGFYPLDISYEFEIPIEIIIIRPVNMKFAENLNHRDFLGGILNLGIEREVIGDILVNNNEAYVFVKNTMSKYIIDNLFKIKHTSVYGEYCQKEDVQYEAKFQEMTGSVASERIDGVISFVYNKSRNIAQELIASGNVFVNGVEISSKSFILKANDIVSVRGFGKFMFMEIISMTKKGRYYIKIKKYI